MLYHGALGVVLDVKMFSHQCAKGLPAHQGRRCESAGEVEALRAEVAGLRAVVERQAEDSGGADLAVMEIFFEAGRTPPGRLLSACPRGSCRAALPEARAAPLRRIQSLSHGMRW